MPILPPAPPNPLTFYPKENYSVAKYMDLTKFISLLYKQSLFFCRADKLDDKFEGTSANTNFEARVEEVKQMQEAGILQTKWEDAQIREAEMFDEGFEQKQRALHCIDCWNIYEGESAALWKIYSDFSKGIMVQSSISNLVSSLAATPEDICMGEIKYRVYKETVLPYGHSNLPFLFKQKAYNYEKEIRLIYSLANKATNDWYYDWSKEDVEEGVYIKADLIKLIDKIIVSPYSPKWFFELVSDLAAKYSINISIDKSEFSIH